jgi:hypothetical protein
MRIRERVFNAVLKATLKTIGVVAFLLTIDPVFMKLGHPAVGNMISLLCLLGIVGYLITWRFRFLRDFFFPKPPKEEETHLR